MCLYPKKFRGMLVDCRKCFECSLKYSNQWAYRIMLEASLYKDNSFFTLTYNNENLESNSLCKRDLQLFIKRLRKHFKNDKLRYFACGEYGSLHGRPHFHIIVFNLHLDDLFFHSIDKKGIKIYRSPTLEKLWTKGFSSVGDLSFDSALYCAKYMQKSLDKDDNRVKPFTIMSLKPGIGANAINAKMLLTDKIYFNGKHIPIPRYFLKVFENRDGYDLSELRKKREIYMNGVKFSMEDLQSLQFRRDRYKSKFNTTLYSVADDEKNAERCDKELSYLIE